MGFDIDIDSLFIYSYKFKAQFVILLCDCQKLGNLIGFNKRQKGTVIQLIHGASQTDIIPCIHNRSVKMTEFLSGKADSICFMDSKVQGEDYVKIYICCYLG